MRVIKAKIHFTGLYEWGRGWVNADKRDKYNKYWRDIFTKTDSIFWSYHEKEASRYLVTVGGCIYLHPLRTSFILELLTSCRTFNPDGTERKEYPAIDELKGILNEMCEYCGCGYSIEYAEYYIDENKEYNEQ